MSESAANRSEMERWGMVIDVNRCVGCQTCTIACKQTNDTLPGVQWRQVLDVESGTFPDVERLFLVVGCQHCAEPPCVPVCPTGATAQRADGLITMDYDLCIGCAYCAVACPYQARTIVHEQGWYFGKETIQERVVAHEDRLGVAQKCTFCVEKIDEAKEKGLTPGVDLDVTPACAASCISQAIRFGDFNDPDSNVSQLVAKNDYFQMHAELGTDPQIKYLYTTPVVPGREPAPEDTDDETLSQPENALAGKRQTLWDWRAAMNWCFGGLSSGAAFMAWLAYVLGVLPGAGLARANMIFAALMGVGLFFVFLKIGRKLRSLNALKRPGTSWMSRELYAVNLFYPAVLAGLVWPHWLPLSAAGLAALAFLLCQAKILHMAKGIPAWRAPLIPWMIVATGLFEGAGLLLIGALAFEPSMLPSVISSLPFVGGPAWLETVVPMAAISAIVLAAANAALWRAYRSSAKPAGIGPHARRAIAAASLPLHAVGHALPALLLTAGLALPEAMGWLGPLAGLAILAGGFFWKLTVIVRAAYQQGYALAKMPQRGSGARAAPRLTEPTAPSPAAVAGGVGVAVE